MNGLWSAVFIVCCAGALINLAQARPLRYSGFPKKRARYVRHLTRSAVCLLVALGSSLPACREVSQWRSETIVVRLNTRSAPETVPVRSLLPPEPDR